MLLYLVVLLDVKHATTGIKPRPGVTDRSLMSNTDGDLSRVPSLCAVGWVNVMESDAGPELKPEPFQDSLL